jgi:hypothetical protein
MSRMSIIVAIVYIITAGISSAQGSDYIWPMKLRPELTSRFCDYRAGHFHGGLDIRTGGVTGVPVYAIDDGYVFRATTSFRGYGKALYLKLNDGRIVVYGHLSGFFTALDERIRAAQLKEKKYKQDLYFKSTEFPVKRGQLVALSGESGTGAPHLHFEMRSPDNNPVNPLESGYSLHDEVPPEFDELAIRYYDYGFSPGKPCEIEFLPVIKGKDSKTFTISDTIISNSDLALAVAGGDRVDGSGFFYGFYELRLLVDDSLVFQMKSDSLSYNTTRQLNYVRDLELIRLFAKKTRTDNDLGIFYRLYVPPNSSQYFWPGFGDNSGIIISETKPGQLRKITVVAIDEAGNQSELRFYLKTPDLPQPLASRFLKARDTLRIDFLSAFKAGAAQVEFRTDAKQPFKAARSAFFTKQASGADGNRYENSLSLIAGSGDCRFCIGDQENRRSPWTYFHAGESAEKFSIYGSPDYLKIEYSTPYPEPILKITNGMSAVRLPMTPNGFDHYSTGVIDRNWSGPTRFEIDSRGAGILDTEITLHQVAPGKSAKIISPDSTLSISFQSGSAYYPAYVFPSNGIKTETSFGQAIIYDIQPDVMLADTPLRLSFDIARLGLAGRKVGAYGYSYSTGGWVFIGKIDGSKLEVDAFGLGKVALLEDYDPPVIRSVSPSRMTKSRRPLLSCRISDNLSGLDLDSGLSMSIDGIWVPAEYDIDGGRFSYKVKNSLNYGKHQLEIKAADNQGNVAVKTINFRVASK